MHEMGHTQSLTPININNYTNVDIYNKKLKIGFKSYVYTKLFIIYQVKQGYFMVKWIPAIVNISGYV